MGGSVQYLPVANLLLPPMSVDSIHEMGPRERQAFLEAEVRRLQAKCNRYEDIVANMALGILEVDTQERIVRADERFCSIVGYAESELRGKKASEVLLSGEEVDQMDDRTRARNSGEAGAYEVPITTADGGRKWLLISGVPKRNAEGDIIGSVGIHQDITERKMVEENLRESRDEARAAEKAEREFLTRMSHEIRTPMNAIMGMADLLGDTQLDSEQNNLLTSIRGGSVLLKGLLDDMLDLAKLEAGQRVCHKEATLIEPIVERVTTIFHSQLKEKGVRLEVRFDADLRVGWKVDPSILTQILINSLGNAVKFTDSGTIGLTLSLEGGGPMEPHLVLEVTDSGLGIDQKDLEVVFERFSQASNREVRHGGTGLGLAIVKELCALHGGEATVTSTLGQGSTFRFTLAMEPVLEEADAPVTTETALLEGHRILVVEDNDVNRFLIRTLLGKWKADVTCVENGQEALNLMTENRFDLVFMDIQMPVMDGLEATRRFRNVEREENREPTPIVALSAFAFDHDKEAAKQAGVNLHMSKPFSREELQAVCLGFLSPDL
jgi:PAS domain S-box-containing protein